eukprot:GHRR01020456.1.p1 GENE.GHRR01020456.1~~GHRR01020456.1.p1  ORF type:complete len:363 (+),score=161.74 GHRR01020456.1:526-1614(+)
MEKTDMTIDIGLQQQQQAASLWPAGGSAGESVLQGFTVPSPSSPFNSTDPAEAFGTSTLAPAGSLASQCSSDILPSATMGQLDTPGLPGFGTSDVSQFESGGLAQLDSEPFGAGSAMQGLQLSSSGGGLPVVGADSPRAGNCSPGLSHFGGPLSDAAGNGHSMDSMKSLANGQAVLPGLAAGALQLHGHQQHSSHQQQQERHYGHQQHSNQQQQQQQRNPHQQRSHHHSAAGRSSSGGGAGASGGCDSQVQVFRSQYRGVSYDKKKRKWRVQIKVAALGKSGVSVGYFDTEDAAARAYDRAAIGLLGRQNCRTILNFPIEEYDIDSVPELVGKSREEVKATLKSERAKMPRRRLTNRRRTSR